MRRRDKIYNFCNHIYSYSDLWYPFLWSHWHVWLILDDERIKYIICITFTLVLILGTSLFKYFFKSLKVCLSIIEMFYYLMVGNVLFFERLETSYKLNVWDERIKYIIFITFTLIRILGFLSSGVTGMYG